MSEKLLNHYLLNPTLRSLIMKYIDSYHHEAVPPHRSAVFQLIRDVSNVNM